MYCMSLNALCSLFAPPSWEQTPKWSASEFEAQLFFFFRPPRIHLVAAHPPFCSTSTSLPFSTMPQPTVDILWVCGRYQVGKPLGSGSFGTYMVRSCHTQYSDLIRIGSVYSGKDIKTERDVALKFEVIQDPSSKLAHEYSVYWHISGLHGIPKVYWHGKEGPYRVLVLDRLGSSFEVIVRTPRLDSGAVFTYTMQMVYLILKFMHLCFMLKLIQAFDPSVDT